MNNSVVIEYTPLSMSPKILLNGELLSQYSTLHGLINQPVHMWINIAIAYFDEHIGDSYNLLIVGTSYQQRIVSECSKQSENCFSVQAKNMEMLSDINYKITTINEIATKYGISLRSLDNSVAINVDGFANVEKYLPRGVKLRSAADAKIRLCASKEGAEGAHEALRVYPAGSISIKNEGAYCYLSLPQLDMTDFIYDLWLYEKAIPFINMAKSVLSSAALDKYDSAAIDSAINETVNYVYEPLQAEMEVGEKFPFVYRIFPDKLANSVIRIIPSNENVVTYENGNIRALSQGASTMKLMGMDGELIASHEISVIKSNYIQNIKIIAPFDALCVGDTAKIQILTHPQGADDEAEMAINISNPEVAMALKNGEVTALKPGRSVIQVKSRRAEANFEIIVQPKLKSLDLLAQSDRMTIAHPVQIKCNLTPADAFVDLEWDIDDDSLATINVSPDKMSCSVLANRVGHCVITCTDERTQKSSNRRFLIVQEETHDVLRFFTVISTIFGAILSFVIPPFTGGMWGTPFLAMFLAGLIINLPLSAGIIMSLIGNAKTGGKVKTFKTCLTINLIMLVIFALMMSAF